MSFAASDITFIIDRVRGQHFQVACGKYFEAKHKGTTLIETEMGGIVHPNQYFEESMKFHTPRVETNVAPTPTVVEKSSLASSQFSAESANA